MHIVATAHDLRAADPQGKQYTDLGLKLSLFTNTAISVKIIESVTSTAFPYLF